MYDQNIEYLNENFVTLEQVASITGTDISELETLIAKGQLPKRSYVVTRTVRIESSLDDRYEFQETIPYFPRSFVALVNLRTNSRFDGPDFVQQMESHLLSHRDKAFAYENAIEDKGRLRTELEKELEAYQDGIYGICTLEATPKAIIEKEIAVKKLIDFKEGVGDRISSAEKEQLESLVDGFDAVASLFAPYQRETSSRGKYVDPLLSDAGLESRIKKYE